MRFSDLLGKMARNETLTDNELLQLDLEARRQEDVAALFWNMVQPGTQTLQIDHLITSDAKIKDATIVSAIVGDGDVRLSATGITIANNAHAINFRNAMDTSNSGLIFSDLTDNFWFSQQAAGGTVRLALTPSDGVGRFDFFLSEQSPGSRILKIAVGNTATSNGYLFALGDTTIWDRIDGQTTQFNNGNRDIDFRVLGTTGQMLRMDAGLMQIDFLTPGSVGTDYPIRMGDSVFFKNDAVFNEQVSTPSTPAEGNQVRMYMRNNYFVFQFNEAGTVRYKYLDLTGTGVTWVHSTTAP